MYIGGEWVDSLTGQTFEATNPATQEVIAYLQEGGREDARRAIEAANRARPVAARMSVW
ncbi:MAG: aldehyde dehydrogenase family protein, partial [Candidatus Eremiobacteraeota bacterium]|nr:aldehyde dehydrogenase family protein [Candidatus Eremiobacteraeota bacterium]